VYIGDEPFAPLATAKDPRSSRPVRMLRQFIPSDGFPASGAVVGSALIQYTIGLSGADNRRPGGAFLSMISAIFSQRMTKDIL
jgi:hypothetical protein